MPANSNAAASNDGGAQQPNAPGEVSARPGNEPVYSAFSSLDALSAPYHLHPQFLHGIRPEAAVLPEAPLIVFINARSGGRDGPDLAMALSRALGRMQVFDLSQHKPDKVLQQLWDNFKAAIVAGVPHAATLQSRLRIIVAGGDGTIAWVLGTIKALKLHPIPPVAIMPLGTGNDLSRSFGWGAAFANSWIRSYSGVYNTLLRVAGAKLEDLDCWSLTMRLPNVQLLHHEQGRALPHSLRVTHEVAPPSPITPDAHGGPGAGNDNNSSRLQPLAAAPAPGTRRGPGVRAVGLFWNYVSVGLDARAAYYFHDLRERRPALASNRLANQFWYSFFGCSSGWFCCTKDVACKMQLQVQKPGSDQWEELPIPAGVKAIVVLNLQSYAGGRNLWGPHRPQTNMQGKNTFQEPSYNDGKLEVVGLRHGFHTMAVMGSKGAVVHGQRICQAIGVRMLLAAQHVHVDGQPSHAYLQLDGEPWVQDVPTTKDDDPILIEVAHHGVSKVLHNYQDLDSAYQPQPRPASHTLPVVPEGSRGHIGPLRPPYTTAMASMAGTLADSDAVQVGSERASSVQSGTSSAPWTLPPVTVAP